MVEWARILQGRVKIGLLQKTKFEPGRVTEQRVILLLPSLINNIYFVICIGLIRSYLKLWHLILSLKTLLVDISLYQHTDILPVHSYMYKPFLAIIVLVVIPILPGLAWPYGPSYPWLLTLEPRVLDPPLMYMYKQFNNQFCNITVKKWILKIDLILQAPAIKRVV